MKRVHKMIALALLASTTVAFAGTARETVTLTIKNTLNTALHFKETQGTTKDIINPNSKDWTVAPNSSREITLAVDDNPDSEVYLSVNGGQDGFLGVDAHNSTSVEIHGYLAPSDKNAAYSWNNENELGFCTADVYTHNTHLCLGQ